MIRLSVSYLSTIVKYGYPPSIKDTERGFREIAKWGFHFIELEGLGPKHTVVMQQSDFAAGSNFVLEMDTATKSCNRLVAVVSPDYLLSEYTAPEWAAMFALDPTGKNRRLIPVKIRDCEPAGLLKQIVHINLVGMDPDSAAKKLLTELQGKASNNSFKTGSKKPNLRPRKPRIAQTIRGNGNVQVGRDFHVNSTVKTQQIIKPGPEHISPKQASKIRRHLQTLGQRDEKAGLGSTYGLWMDKFKTAFGITSYHLLLSKAFDQAVGWIGQQKAITRSKLRRTDTRGWLLFTCLGLPVVASFTPLLDRLSHGRGSARTCWFAHFLKLSRHR